MVGMGDEGDGGLQPTFPTQQCCYAEERIDGAIFDEAVRTQNGPRYGEPMADENTPVAEE
jgi:hypothetical protein